MSAEIKDFSLANEDLYDLDFQKNVKLQQTNIIAASGTCPPKCGASGYPTCGYSCGGSCGYTQCGC